VFLCFISRYHLTHPIFDFNAPTLINQKARFPILSVAADAPQHSASGLDDIR
jgi:hypothetical protein